MKRIVLFAALSAAFTVVAGKVDVRLSGPVDLSLAEGLSFEAQCDDWSQVTSLCGAFDSRIEGGMRGYYMTSLKEKDLPRSGTNAVRLTIGKANLYNIERDPPGWAHVRFASLTFRTKGEKAPACVVREVKPVPAKGGDAVVIFPEQGLEHNRIGIFNGSLVGRTPRIRKLLAAEGIDATIVSLRDFAAGCVPEGVKLAVLPYSVKTPEIEAAKAAFTAKGGVWWATERVFFDDLGAELTRRVPAFAEKCAAAKAARAAEHARDAAEIAKMPGAPDEVRVLDCHDAWTSSGKGVWRDWETIASNCAASGITHLMVNLHRGPFAAYASKVLLPWPKARRVRETDALEECKAACEKYGLKLMVWRCCWGLPAWLAPKELVEEYRAAGRVQKNYRGEWLNSLCPSHPENLRLEIESQVEMASKGVWGIHYDYIRYDNDESCYCENCRAALEKILGRKVAKWPEDAMNGCDKSAWLAYRRECIGRVVREVSARVRRDYPAVHISASVLSDEPAGVASGCGQDWTAWCRNGWLDAALPMDYSADCDEYRRTILKQAKYDVGKARIWPNLGPSCWPKSARVDWLTARQILITRECGFKGWAIFALNEGTEKMLPVLRAGPLKPCAPDETAALQSRIDAVSAAGGGRVELSPGEHHIRSIVLKSGVELYLKTGARLLGSRNPDDYAIDLSRADVDDHTRRRWCNAMIRVLNAHDVAITGEKGSEICGRNCYDGTGEEGFRGPHAISCYNVTNLTLKGLFVRDAGNYALYTRHCAHIRVREVEISGGHDGFDFFNDADILVENCTIRSGDDCVAGHGNKGLTVRNCELNSACSFFRLGGDDVLVENCRGSAPALHPHRISLPDDVRRLEVTPDGAGRLTTLAFLTYFSGKKTVAPAKNMVFRNCRVSGLNKLMHYNFAERWQVGMGPRDITFDNVVSENMPDPICIYTDAKTPLDLTFRNCRLTFKNEVGELIRGGGCVKVRTDGLEVEGVKGPFFRTWENQGSPTYDCRGLKGVEPVSVSEKGVFAIKPI